MGATTTSQFLLSTARRRFGLLLLGWGGLVVLAATTGVSQTLLTTLVPVPIVILLAVPLLLYACSERLQSLIAAEDLRWLTLFHTWRIPAGLACLWYGAQGHLPFLSVGGSGPDT